MARRTRARTGVLLAGAALAVFGSIRFLFNAVGVRVFGAEFLGGVSPYLSSAALLVLVTISPLATIVSRFVGLLLGAGKERDADVVLRRMVLLSSAIATLTAVTFLAVAPSGGRWPIAIYAGLLAHYFLFRRVFLSYGRSWIYFGAELAGFGVFCVLLLVAAITGNALLSLWALVGHLSVFWVVGLFVFRAKIFRPVAHKGAPSLPSGITWYGIYSSWLALAGLATSHVIIVLAGILPVDRETVGYISALFAILSPLQLVPNAIGSVLLPELSFALGRGENDRAIVLAKKGWLVLAGTFAIVFLAGWAVSTPVLEVTGLAGVPGIRVAWILVLAGACFLNSTAAIGQFLNATALVRAHAIASLVCALAAVPVGVIALPANGLLGAAATRLASSIPLALWRVLWGWSAAVRAVTGVKGRA